MTATQTARALPNPPGVSGVALAGARPPQSSPDAPAGRTPPTISGTWTSERIEKLKSSVAAGLTCSQIARELGVSRNAVIGKLNRLGLARGRAPARRADRTNLPRPRQPSVLTQRQMLQAVYAEAAPAIAETPTVISLARCSLLDLTHATCRWPVGEAEGSETFFCGNRAAAGLPYCPGHVRMAYRVPARRHA